MSDIKTILNSTYNGKRVLIKTSDIDRYTEWLWQQNAGDPRWNAAKSKINEYNLTAKICWEKFNWFQGCLKIANIDVDNVKKVIDVGSGLGAIDILSSQYMPNTNFFLVDRDCKTLTEKSNYFSQSIDESNYHGFYNSFDTIKDAIFYSLKDTSKINFLDPTDEWPNDVDIVFSLFSWMWHYHKDIYWDQLLKSLKIDGSLIVMITIRQGEECLIQKISSDLGSYPLYIEEMSHGPENPDYHLLGADKVTHRACYIWKRLK